MIYEQDPSLSRFCRLLRSASLTLAVCLGLSFQREATYAVSADGTGEPGKAAKPGPGSPPPSDLRLRIGSSAFTVEGEKPQSFAVSADGRWLACLTTAQNVFVLDAVSGTIHKSLTTRTIADPPDRRFERCPLALSRDGSEVASCLDGDQVLRWDRKTGKELDPLVIEKSPGVVAIAFAPDRTEIAVCCKDKTIRILDLASGKEVAKLENALDSGAMAYSQAGLFAYADGGGNILLWDSGDRKALGSLKGHRKPVRSLQFDLAGKVLASVDEGESIRLWDSETQQPRKHEGQPIIIHQKHAGSIVFSAEGSRLFAGAMRATDRAADGLIYGWDTSTGKEAGLWKLTDGGSLLGPAIFAADGSAAYEALGGGRISAVLLKSEAESDPRASDRRLIGPIAFSPDSRLVAQQEISGDILIMNARDGKVAQRIRGHSGTLSHLQFAPDGKHLLSQARDVTDDSISVWELASGKELFRRAGKQTHQAEFAGKDSLVLWSRQNLAPIEVRGARDGKLIRSIANDAGMITKFLLAPNGKSAVALLEKAGNGIPESRLGFVDLERGGIRVLGVAIVDVVCLSRSGESVVVVLPPEKDAPEKKRAAGFRVEALDARTGRPTQSIAEGIGASWRNPGERVVEVASPDRRTVAVSRGATVELWELKTGKLRRRFEERKTTVRMMAFSPDGRTLACAGIDGTMLLWSLPEIVPAKTEPPTPEQLVQMIGDLGTLDAEKAFAAGRRLAAWPKLALEVIPKEYRLEGSADAIAIKKLLEELDSDEFAKRKHARAKLEKLGREAVAYLKEALASKPSLSLSQEIQAILDCMGGAVPTIDEIRTDRLVEVLEWIDSAESRALLAKWAKGEAGVLAANAAKRALERGK